MVGNLGSIGIVHRQLNNGLSSQGTTVGRGSKKGGRDRTRADNCCYGLAARARIDLKTGYLVLLAKVRCKQIYIDYRAAARGDGTVGLTKAQ